MNTEPFSVRSFVAVSPSRLQRIYTTVSPNRLLLTAQSKTFEKKIKEGVLMELLVDDGPNICIGYPLLSLGIPLFGVITGIMICPSPLDADILRVIINYHPLPKPNIRNIPNKD
jgi:hypothetical protein